MLKWYTSDSVLMFKTNADHNYDEIKKFTSSYGLSALVKTEINRLFDLKMKPKSHDRKSYNKGKYQDS